MTVVAIIGAGTMGPGMAATLARAGMEVRITDVSAAAMERAPELAAQAWAVLGELGVPERGGLDRITYAADLAAAAAGAGLAIENVPERLELKRQVLAELAAVVPPGCVLASDTSGIPITRLQDGMPASERIVGMHWSNPPHIIPVIEVIRGQQTSPATVEAVVEIVHAIGHRPIVVKRDVPGFVENRILYALLREAVDLVEQGVIEPEGLDACVSWGIGYKLAVVGPMALLDMAGLDIYRSVSSYLNAELCARPDVSPAIAAKVEAGELGLKAGGGMYAYAPGEVEALRARRAALFVATRLALTSRP